MPEQQIRVKVKVLACGGTGYEKFSSSASSVLATGQLGSGGCEGIRLEALQSGLESGLNMVKLIKAENQPSKGDPVARRHLFSTSSQGSGWSGAQTDSKRQRRRCLVECDGGKFRP